MSESSQRKELEAFINFFTAFSLTKDIRTVNDLSDGAALFEVLQIVDSDYFRQSSRPSAQPSDNWVLRFGALKRLYRLITQYFADVLQKPTSELDVPDLQAMAKDGNLTETLAMCRLTIAIGVQCEKNKEFIGKIQGLNESNQHFLMKAIEQVMARIRVNPELHDYETTMTEDDHYYRIQSERSQMFLEKETIERVYQVLLDEHRTLQTNYDDVLSEKEELAANYRELQREADSRRNEKSDVLLRAEIDRLRTELQKSEENFAVAEAELEKQTTFATELTRKVEDLQIKADEAVRLKDQVDEYRHAADKLQKTENVMEKYKKKLQEGADLRQQVKALEKQNADLVDKNATLEEENRKVAVYKPLLDSYKSQNAELEAKLGKRLQVMESLKFELEQSQLKLQKALAERRKDSEALELYQERVRELELSSQKLIRTTKARDENDGVVGLGESSGAVQHETDEHDDPLTFGLEGELEDAISGTTMTDLKLQIRKLQRQLETAHRDEGVSGEILVLKNLLEDAKRGKERYEKDYLGAHREKLVLQRELEDIRSGKSMGDGPEAAIALRRRLNETVGGFEVLRKQHAELEIDLERTKNDLATAQANLIMVDKDQLEVLAHLRASVNEEKASLEEDVNRLKLVSKELGEKNRLQLEQINGLLLEKVSLQNDGIGQRERMLQRERDFADFRQTLSGEDIPEEFKQRLLILHEENVTLKENLKTAQDKLAKARQFIKSQDKLFKEQYATVSPSSANFGEAELSFRSQIKLLEEELTRSKQLLNESHKRSRREQELMMGAIHRFGVISARHHLGRNQQGRADVTSWLGIQRQNLSHSLKR